MESKISVSVVGATGRMGIEVLKGLHQHATLFPAHALTHANSLLVNREVHQVVPELSDSQYNLQFKSDLAAIKNSQVVIDFALPNGLTDRLLRYADYGVPAVICTTGLTDNAVKTLEQVSQKIPVLYAANTSVGCNVLFALVRQASAMFGQAADIEIFEAHHKHKVDAPSGTALALGQAAATGRGQVLDEVMELHRNGTQSPRKSGSIGFSTLRGGSIVGEHTVYFITEAERIELTHRVQNRVTFAEGALRAAQWLYQHKNNQTGLYSMKDVLQSG